MADKALGYAVIDEAGFINIRSVGPTWRSAVVNFLCTNRGLPLLNSVTDDEVHALWAKYKGKAELKQVEIRVLV